MVRTIFTYFCLFLLVILATVIGFPLNFICLFGLRKLRLQINRLIGKYWALALIKIIGCKVTVTGRENIPPKEGFCFVSNHCSIFDIVLILAYADRPLGFIAKKELAIVPLINIWIPMLGGLYIDRKNMRNSLTTINKGITRIQTGGTMVVFPEGRRSRGQGLLPFHAGSMRLATHAKAPIIPIAISGTYDIFEKTYRVCPGPVYISFGKVIETAELSASDRKQLLTAQIYDEIKNLLGAQGNTGAPANLIEY